MVKLRKYDNPLCSNDMDFEDCELAILRSAIDFNELESKKMIVKNPIISQITKILEKFLVKKKLICYGGTAINNILPKSKQFYDKNVEIPDYDFYSETALEDAKELADIYLKAGYIEVEAKAGVHFGTYKVFVNYIPIADITHLDESILMSIRKECIKVDKILYAPPNFLRMNMYLELSRPAGDVSRWEKVFKRLSLLNSYYPFVSKNCSKMKLFDDSINKPVQEVLNNCIRDVVIKESAVFFGGFAAYLYSKYIPDNDKSLLKKYPEFDILATDAKNLTDSIVSKLNSLHVKENNIITVIEHDAIGEIIPHNFEIQVNGNSIAFVYKTLSCHSYNTLNISRHIVSKNNVKRREDIKVRVATIDTMISFYLAFYYSDKPYYHQDRILCMTKLLFDVEEKNRLNQSGLLKRFSNSCYGEQLTLSDIRLQKTRKFKELHNKEREREYEEWFLKYNPSNKIVPKKNVSKKRLAKNNRKTQKTIVESMKSIGII